MFTSLNFVEKLNVWCQCAEKNEEVFFFFSIPEACKGHYIASYAVNENENIAVHNNIYFINCRVAYLGFAVGRNFLEKVIIEFDGCFGSIGLFCPAFKEYAGVRLGEKGITFLCGKAKQ